MRTLALVALMVLTPALTWAEGPAVSRATCKTTWVAPTQNEDGTALTDLKEYRLYFAGSLTELNAMTAPTAVIQSPVPSPAPNTTLEWSCAGLAVRQWYVTVTAVDLGGNESARHTPVPFVLVGALPKPPTLLQVIGQ